MHKLIQKIPERYRLAVGWFLVIAGAVLGPVPVIQGWLLGLPGLIILAEHYHWARRVLVWAKLHDKFGSKPMAEIVVGLHGEEKLLVTSEVAIDFLGVEGARVLGTPHLIGWLEMTARNSVLPLLEKGNDTVGTHVNVAHLAATPMGMHVKFHSEVVSIEDRRINFKVEAFDEKEKIAEGTHQRAIVNIAKFATRVQAKAAGK